METHSASSGGNQEALEVKEEQAVGVAAAALLVGVVALEEKVEEVAAVGADPVEKKDSFKSLMKMLLLSATMMRL